MEISMFMILAEQAFPEETARNEEEEKEHHSL
jgi:hypothetical protein